MRRLNQIMLIVAAVLACPSVAAQQSVDPSGPGEESGIRPLEPKKDGDSHMKCGPDPITGKVGCKKVYDKAPSKTPAPAVKVRVKVKGKGAQVSIVNEDEDPTNKSTEPMSKPATNEPTSAVPKVPDPPEPVPPPSAGNADIPTMWDKASKTPMVVEDLKGPTADAGEDPVKMTYFVGVEAGLFGRIQSFSPNARRPIALGPEMQMLIRLTEKWRVRFGGGVGYGGDGSESQLYALWLLAGTQAQLSSLLNLSFGFEFEQRFSDGEIGTETNFYGGYVQGQACFSPQKDHNHVCIGLRSSVGAQQSQGDLTGEIYTRASLGLGLNVSYAFLP